MKNNIKYYIITFVDENGDIKTDTILARTYDDARLNLKQKYDVREILYKNEIEK